MKKLAILFAWAALAAAGCSETEPFAEPSSGAEPTVAVGFSMQAVETETSVEPMTRATYYTNYLRGKYRFLFLKKVDTRWIVDTTFLFAYDNYPEESYDLKIEKTLPTSRFRLELRPGDYRVVAVINARSGAFNSALIPGTVVADSSKPDFRTPPLLTYMISTHWMNNGYRQLNREIFVAVRDFTVPKSGDLHSVGVPEVVLKAERRVGKFRFLLKETPELYNGFEDTSHRIAAVFRSQTPFPEGIDALGGMYYSEEKLYELPYFISTVNTFHPSGTASYQMNEPNSTVYSPFLFFDPKEPDIPFDIEVDQVDGRSGGYDYRTDAIFRRTLGASKVTGLVLEATGRELDDSKIEVVEATDAKGDPEDASQLFDVYYEWNITSN